MLLLYTLTISNWYHNLLLPTIFHYYQLSLILPLATKRKRGHNLSRNSQLVWQTVKMSQRILPSLQEMRSARRQENPTGDNNPSTVTENEDGLELRLAMRREESLAKEFDQKSKEAARNLNFEEARKFWKISEIHRERKEEEKQKAEAAIFEKNNKFRRFNVLDLHGLFVEEAIHRLKQFLAKHEMLRTRTVTVITGRGLHSRDGVPKIKPRIIDHIRNTVNCYYRENSGDIEIRMDPPQGYRSY